MQSLVVTSFLTHYHHQNHNILSNIILNSFLEQVVRMLYFSKFGYDLWKFAKKNSKKNEEDTELHLKLKSCTVHGVFLFLMNNFRFVPSQTKFACAICFYYISIFHETYLYQFFDLNLSRLIEKCEENLYPMYLSSISTCTFYLVSMMNKIMNNCLDTLSRLHLDEIIFMLEQMIEQLKEQRRIIGIKDFKETADLIKQKRQMKRPKRYSCVN